ncbi:MAG TPA: bifunctional oligoribonuclease/PAP phosphatase NrnA [Actinomycetota bacterium]|nr:bifunctional oligoribonuclease/PAP phosphatase NrnA [Actinomycetota bacterium]
MRSGVKDWDAAVQALKNASSVDVACHLNPDGDALGSLLGAALGLKQLGLSVRASWSSELVQLPDSYAFLPGADLLVLPAELGGSDAFLALDCGAGHRLGSIEKTAQASPCLINVDHHPGNDDFGRLNIVVTTASSTAEIVTRLLQDLGVTIDKQIATCLYVGVVTDTGRFQYSNSTPDTLRLAADLLSLGVDAPFIAQEVYESSPFGFLKLVGRVLDRAVLHDEQRFVYSWIRLADLEETGVAADETDGLIDLIRSTRAADVAAMFKEQRDGAWRVSLRSKGPSVGELARARGGGGHELAAGFTTQDMATAAADLVQALGALRA